ncbi:hypothetical protein [Chitinasiproducens palmae]|uniref:Uncharacterized protein n=1 Tax=Chitinasiproducens palmae TaxID=1770053 RepID=A0A1H2PK27_9BURK|nr:hypothetical protein [Chitinasiproducens palmae]SDV46754.1 hypothetical protein SAMN05216551_101607 [Chitinasiproducens palmae]
MFTCRNQPCRAEWQLSDIDIENEGQGLLFRCPICGARNPVIRHDGADGIVRYEQTDELVPVTGARRAAREAAAAPGTASIRRKGTPR